MSQIMSGEELPSSCHNYETFVRNLNFQEPALLTASNSGLPTLTWGSNLFPNKKIGETISATLSGVCSCTGDGRFFHLSSAAFIPYELDDTYRHQY
jgi:hypothetical protein